MQITGLDISLTSTGIARLVITDTGDHVMESTLATSTGKRGDTIAQRAERLEQMKHHICHEASGSDLVVIEGPAYGMTGGSVHDRSGLWWAVVSWLIPETPVAVVAGTTLKKFATGSGAAKKDRMGIELFKRTGEEPGNDDEVDAQWLAYAGAVYCGYNVVNVPVSQSEALSAAQWPETCPTRPEALDGAHSDA